VGQFGEVVGDGPWVTGERLEEATVDHPSAVVDGGSCAGGNEEAGRQGSRRVDRPGLVDGVDQVVATHPPERGDVECPIAQRIVRSRDGQLRSVHQWADVADRPRAGERRDERGGRPGPGNGSGDVDLVELAVELASDIVEDRPGNQDRLAGEAWANSTGERARLLAKAGYTVTRLVALISRARVTNT